MKASEHSPKNIIYLSYIFYIPSQYYFVEITIFYYLKKFVIFFFFEGEC